MERALPFTLAIRRRSHPIVDLSWIKPEQIACPEKRDVITVHPTIDCALTYLKAFG
jgi:hypothetical protein